MNATAILTKPEAKPAPWRIEGFGTLANGEKFKLISYGVNAYGDGPQGYVGKIFVSDADAKIMAASRDILASLKTCIEALDQCEDYFDTRQDADCDQEGFIPNAEMKLLGEVSRALNAAQSAARKVEG